MARNRLAISESKARVCVCVILRVCEKDSKDERVHQIATRCICKECQDAIVTANSYRNRVSSKDKQPHLFLQVGLQILDSDFCLLREDGAA